MSISDPWLVKPKCVWELSVLFIRPCTFLYRMYIMVKNTQIIISASMVYWVRHLADILEDPGSNPSQIIKLITFTENFNFSKFFKNFYCTKQNWQLWNTFWLYQSWVRNAYFQCQTQNKFQILIWVTLYQKRFIQNLRRNAV